MSTGWLGALAVFFVVQAFLTDVGSGLRSSAAVVFPLMVLAFVKAGQLMNGRRRPVTVYVLSEGRDRAAPYCLGLVIGSLGYVILVGIPQF
ncbi:hypothetical protein [Actinophytocola xanthii]|uniref:Uncharacterized protein n=1 Tax=Actinophytocola xanthii TaxID=1912961 RepID=A0A1Q8BU91_9PSEU|nr:hypothetical protein [Actinophytocola xanthii]OLF05663.1 hypothetical protein BU204_36935 [Actinophytocola xanthii]